MTNGDTVQAEDGNQQAEETAVNETETVEETQTTESPEGEENVESSEESTDNSQEETEERPVWTMPVSKAQEEKRKAVEKARQEAQEEAQKEMERMRSDYEQKLNDARQSDPSKADYDKRLEAVAKEHNLEPTAAKALLDIFKESVQIPDMSKFDQFAQAQAKEEAKLAASKQFDEKVLPLLKKDFPNATQEHIDEVKNRIVDPDTGLAFSKGYNTYRLEDIYQVKKGEFEFKNGFTAESSGGKASEIVSFKRLSDKEEIELAANDSEGYRAYINWLDSQDGRYMN